MAVWFQVGICSLVMIVGLLMGADDIFEKGACTHGVLSSGGRFAIWTVGVNGSCYRISCGYGVMIPLGEVNGVLTLSL